MNIDAPTLAQIPALRALWQQAFGDSTAFLDCFFSVGFSAERSRCLTLDDQPVSMLYWFDSTCGDKKLAYLYAVATDNAFQGRGFCQRLMKNTHAHLKELGYAGAVLSPGSTSLFTFYQRLGYRAFGPVDQFACSAGNVPVPLYKCTAEEYAALRRQYLPKGGIVQEDVTLRFLATQADFYRGEDFLLCGYIEESGFRAEELLGNSDAAPGILSALQVLTGQFRIPGSSTPLAMICPFSPMDTLPTYLGLPLD